VWQKPLAFWAIDARTSGLLAVDYIEIPCDRGEQETKTFTKSTHLKSGDLVIPRDRVIGARG
jgi:hypothetical protein